MHPSAKCWIKADGCDVVSGLEESVCLEWNGDADYGTEAVQELYNLYRTRLSAADKLCTDQPIQDSRQTLIIAINDEYNKLCDDVKFVGEGMHVQCT